MKFTDPIMQQLVEKYPAPHFTDKTDHLYEHLIESIVSQQLSVKASDTIFKRFQELFEKKKKHFLVLRIFLICRMRLFVQPVFLFRKFPI